MSDDRAEAYEYEAPHIVDRVRVDAPLIGLTSPLIVKELP
jgi:hypothetical protein